MNRVVFSIAYVLTFVGLTIQSAQVVSGENNSSKSAKVTKNSVLGGDVAKKEDKLKSNILEDEKKVPSKSILYKSAQELEKVGSVEKFDFNKDNKIDFWAFYNKSKEDDSNEESELKRKSKLLYRKDLDINFDGRVDVIKQYKDGELIREAFDFDYDGKFDMTSFYKNGKIVLKEFDLNGDQKADVWKYYNNDKLILKESDKNFDGILDLWTYFRDEKIIKIGQDTNGDGSPDKWTR